MNEVTVNAKVGQKKINESEDREVELQRYPDKSLTDEVSRILTSLPETATTFDVSQPHSTREHWTKVSINMENTSNIDEQVDGECQDNSSPLSSSASSSENENEKSEAESSELDEEDCNKRRSRCQDEMAKIEKQFIELREQLFKERHAQITKRLEEVEAATAPEYLQQVERLQQHKQDKLQVASKLRQLRMGSLHTILEAEKQANDQHFNNEKEMLIEKIQGELDEKVHRLEEDRDNVDFSTDLWTDTLGGSNYDSLTAGDNSSAKGKRNKRKEEPVPMFNFGNTKRKKKPVTVTGPYLVYMLRDADIIDDWAVIKRATNISKRRSHTRNFKKRYSSVCRYEDGKFFCGGKYFMKGQNVTIRSRGASVTYGTIAGLSATEVLVEQNNGTKSKLYSYQLQRGRYTLHHR